MKRRGRNQHDGSNSLADVVSRVASPIINRLFFSQPWIIFGLLMLFVFFMINSYFNAWAPGPSRKYYSIDDDEPINMINTNKNDYNMMNNNNMNNNNMNNNNMNRVERFEYNDRSWRIILSVATGVDPNRIYLFMASFRKFHPNSDIYKMYLFTDFNDANYFEQYSRLAKEFSIDLVDIVSIEKQLDDKYSQQLPKTMKYVKINKRRFFVLYEWIANIFQYSNKIELVMICDTNDVIFQGNIFSLADETLNANQQLSFGLNELFWFFMEAPDVYMHNEKWNRRYIKYCFGNATITEFINKHVSCSGTSLATYGAMYYYLELMNNMLLQQGPKFEECLTKPGDQGLHNVILHRRYLEDLYGVNVIRVPNDAGWILQITTMINHPTFKHKVPDMAKESVVVHQWKWARTLKEQYESDYDYMQFCRIKKWQACSPPKG